MKDEAPARPAENMQQLIENFNHLRVIDEKLRIFYVDIFKEELDDLRIRLKMIDNLPPNITFFITGQRGTGKSSALHQLPTPDLLQQFEFKFITFYKEQNIADIDIVDVLFHIGYSLIKDDKKLLRRFDKKIKELKDLYDDTISKLNLKEIEKEGDFTLKLWAKFRANKTFRTEVREKIKPNIDDFVDIVSDIILEYSEKLVEQNKRLLLILDDLEKMTDSEQIIKLFVDSQEYLHRLNVVKIIAFPVNLPTEDARFNVSHDGGIYRFSIRVTPAPDFLPDEIVERNRELFREVVRKRVKNMSLIKLDAIEMAIDYSGGIVRQFIKLIQDAAFNAMKENFDNPVITVENVKQAVARNRLNMSYSVVGIKRKLLKYVKEHKNLPEVTDKTEKDELINAILGNLIIVYPNDEAWYDVNPLISEILDK